MNRRWSAIGTLILLATTTPLWAQQLTTDAERTYRELRDSTDVKTKLMAERWYGAIRLQEWTDASGKFRTTAKYVEHDPEFAWVKLRVIQGTGEKRVVRDVMIPLEKLSKICQARVRTIGVLSEKVAEAVAAEKERDTDEAAGDAGRGGEMMDERMPGEDPRGGRGEYGASLAGMDPQQALMENERVGEREMTVSTPPTVSNTGPPLPALLPALPGLRDEAAVAASQPQATPPADAATTPDTAPWRTSYDAFHANISVEPVSRSEYRINWGPMPALEEAYTLSKRISATGEISEESGRQIDEQFGAVGEFTWEATLAEAPVEDGNWTNRLNLPPLPEPLHLGFVLDDARGAGNWQNLKPGDHVRFTGRFIAFESEYDLVAAIRFPPESPAATGVPSQERR